MSVIGRRAFIKRLALGAAVVVAAPVLAELVAAAPPARLVDRNLGISIRFIQQWEISGPITRLDLLYGWPPVVDLPRRVVA